MTVPSDSPEPSGAPLPRQRPPNPDDVDTGLSAFAQVAAATGASASASLHSGLTWRQAADAVTEALGVHEPDLAVVFVDSRFAAHYEDVVKRIRQVTGARHLIGCSADGVIGPGLEAEQIAAISVMTFRLPNVVMTPLALVGNADPAALFGSVEAAHAKAWLVFGDPFTTHTERLITAIEERAPDAVIVGGMASAEGGAGRTGVFLGDRVYGDGAVLLGVGGEVEVHALVAQGAEPIGRPWTVTDCEANTIKTIGSRPAFDILRETLAGLDEETRDRAQRNLLVGLAMDEYRHQYGRGDYLMRNIMGFDRETGAIAISGLPRLGQTIQFQFRDAAAADQDLVTQLAAYKARLDPDQVVLGALLCSCNGRGRGLFGVPNHDAAALAEALGAVPTAGLFCNGEIGPVGGKTFLHGFTASIAFLTTPSK